LLVSLLIATLPTVCLGAESRPVSRVPRSAHAWARFDENAWKRYRVVVENRDGSTVTSTSTTETKTSLEKVEDDGITLQFEAVTEVAGKCLVSEPTTVKYGLHGEPANDHLSIRDGGTADVTIGEAKYPCQVELIESHDEKTQTTTKVYYCPKTPPFVLRRESVTMDVEGMNKVSETVLEVKTLDVPFKILERTLSTSYIEVTTTQGGGRTKTCAYSSIHVPGGIVSHTSYQWDDSKRLVRQSTLTLVGYGFVPEKERPSVIQRWRTRHKTHRAAR
jgi:hypothetical protein